MPGRFVRRLSEQVQKNIARPTAPFGALVRTTH